MKFQFMELGDGNLGIFLDQELLAPLQKDGNKRVMVTWESHVHHCAIMRSSQGHYLRFGKANHKKWGITAGSVIDATIQIDGSEYQFEWPDSLAEVLASDFEAKLLWSKLSPGKQRSIIYQIAKIKSTDLQINKCLLLADRLKAGIDNPNMLMKPRP